MQKLPNYAALYTLRADGRYQGYWRDADGKRHTLCDRDPHRLYDRLAERERPPEKPPATVSEAGEAWKAIRFEELSYKTVEAYKPVYGRIAARFGDRVLDNVETREVSAWLALLGQQGYARRTVQMHRDMLGQIYRYAIGEGMTRNDPVEHAYMPKGLDAGTRGIAPDAAIEAVKNGAALPFGLFAFVCYYAGLRRGEALGLRYEDIDRAAKVIHVSRSVIYAGNVPRLKEPKTENSRRDVILLDVLADALPRKKRGYVFAGEDGALLSRDAYRKRWARYCALIGHEITAHQLRHGYATLLYEAGIGDKDTQAQLGHANIELTRNVYQHISAAQLDRTAAKLNAFVEKEKNAVPEDDVVAQIMGLLEGRDAPAILAQVAAKLAAANAQHSGA